VSSASGQNRSSTIKKTSSISNFRDRLHDDIAGLHFFEAAT
jgi:hypothetical protein